ncbi:MAG: sigma-70 family RNA polymerase sigma factor [Bacteroidales bacterium]
MEPLPNTTQIRPESEQISLAKDDIRQFEPLYDKYYTRIFLFIYRKMDRKEDAADLTSNVFLKAMNSLHSYEITTAPFSHYLLVIAKNEVAEFYRRKGLEQKYFANQRMIEQIARDTEYEPSEGFFLIRKILELLPPHDFELIDLKYFNEMSVREISGITGLNENKIRVRLHRIRERIGKMIRSKVPGMTRYGDMMTLTMLMFTCIPIGMSTVQY